MERFARTSELGEFARPTAHGAGVLRGAYDAKADPEGAAIVAKGVRTSGLDCLNFLVGDALELVPDSLAYLALLRTPEVFRFCAIPQVMAIATLEACFNNPKVFTGVVKIRKGLTARLLLDSASLDGVHFWFHALAKRVIERCPEDDLTPKGARRGRRGRAPCAAQLKLGDALSHDGARGGRRDGVAAFGAEMCASPRAASSE